MRSAYKNSIVNYPVYNKKIAREPENTPYDQGWAKLVLIALERYSVALKRLTYVKS